MVNTSENVGDNVLSSGRIITGCVPTPRSSSDSPFKSVLAEDDAVAYCHVP
jgi:hypothetical protein